MAKKQFSKKEEAVCCDEEKGICEPCSYEEYVGNLGEQNEEN